MGLFSSNNNDDTWDGTEQKDKYSVSCPNCGSSHDVYFESGWVPVGVSLIVAPHGRRLDVENIRSVGDTSLARGRSEKFKCGCDGTYNGTTYDDLWMQVHAVHESYVQ